MTQRAPIGRISSHLFHHLGRGVSQCPCGLTLVPMDDGRCLFVIPGGLMGAPSNGTRKSLQEALSDIPCVQWKARAKDMEQILLRTLKCEYGRPGSDCPWWKAYLNGTLPPLRLAIPKCKPEKGRMRAEVWLCDLCIKRYNHKVSRDPIGEAGKPKKDKS